MNSATFEEHVRLPFFLTILFVACVALYSPDKALAQWTTIGNNISNTNTGNVGIGTTNPLQALDVVRSGADASANYAALQVKTSGSSGFGPAVIINAASITSGHNWQVVSAGSFDGFSVGKLGFYDATASALRMAIDTSGNVGIGTTTPGEKLTLAGGLSFTDRGLNGTGDIHLSNNNSAVRIFASSTLDFIPAGAAFQFFGNASNFPGQAFIDAGANNSAAIILRTAPTGGTITERMRITAAGNVGIGTTAPDPNYMLHVTGAVRVDGNIAAKYQDVAEWVPSSCAIPAGTVVVLDADQSNHVLPSSRAYDTRVAGVVSAKPGVILGEGGEGKVMVATTGRVRVKVDATTVPIRVGDLLVTSDKEGVAMRSVPLDLGGTPIHRPGTLIGKALEPLEKGIREILVLLSLQ